jgi:hypothetical protein
MAASTEIAYSRCRAADDKLRVLLWGPHGIFSGLTRIMEDGEKMDETEKLLIALYCDMTLESQSIRPLLGNISVNEYISSNRGIAEL